MEPCTRLLLLGSTLVLAACSASPGSSSTGSESGSGASSSSSGLGPSSSGNIGQGSSGSSSGSGSSGSGSSSSTSGSSGSGGATGSSGGAASSSSGGAGADGGSREGGTARADAGDAGAAEGGPANGGGDGGAGGFDPCPTSGNCKILPLGDSITFGTPTNNGGYRVELFSRSVGDSKHITFVGSQSNGPNMVAGMPFPKANEGHPGWTIAQINGISTTTMALLNSPQILLLHIGTNDMPSMSAGAPDRLGQLIDKIVAALPNSLLAVSSIIPFPAVAANVNTYNAAVPGVVQQRATQGKHVIFVEMFKGFPSNGLGGDGIHPNDNVGYPFMGDTWYAAIRQYLH
jgi:GDSL-like lipase/acylhydrolase family protein